MLIILPTRKNEINFLKDYQRLSNYYKKDFIAKVTYKSTRKLSAKEERLISKELDRFLKNRGIILQTQFEIININQKQND